MPRIMVNWINNAGDWTWWKCKIKSIATAIAMYTMETRNICIACTWLI